MSIPVTSEQTVHLSVRQRAVALAAVALARPLAALPPRRIRQVLQVISRGTRPAGHDQAWRARAATVTVSARCAGLGCLQRSIATVLICRLSNRWPDWCTGFRMDPFGAHAWVEVNGAPVGEPADVARFRTVISVRCPEGTS
jgi:hypothetical protein